MLHTIYHTALAEEEARVAAIYPVGLIGDPEHAPEWLEELFDNAADPSDELFQQLPELAPHDLEPSVWAEKLCVAGRAGFIVNYEVCIRKYLAGETSWTSSWGLYRFHFMYAETYEEIGPAVLASARKQHAAELAEAGAA